MLNILGITIAVTVILYLLFDIRSSVRSTGSHSKGASFVMDSSALIDGRVIDVVEAGFLQGVVIVPKAVLNELQLLADGRDTQKRSRARAGLEAAEKLQKNASLRVVIDEAYLTATVPTDEAILRLARDRRARLCTTDYNLHKVAAAEGVSVCNVNELAHSMRPSTLPGETIDVAIIQKGESRGQGVGYLPDGTMVVVEGAQKRVGSSVGVKVDRIIQTKSGKMVFATYKVKNKG